MIVRGLVESFIDKSNIRVRIPFLDRVEQSAIKTENSDLPIAKVCTLPGYEMNLQIGDPVYIAFENNDISKPVILGILSVIESREAVPTLNSANINCSSSASLPENTAIGKVTPQNIQSLQNISGNIQYQLDKLREDIENLKNI